MKNEQKLMERYCVHKDSVLMINFKKEQNAVFVFIKEKHTLKLEYSEEDFKESCLRILEIINNRNIKFLTL